MNRLISTIARKRYVSVGDGKNIKSIAYVENLVEATLFLMDRLKPGVELFNYSDAPHLNSSEIASIIADSLNVTLPRIRVPVSVALGLTYPLDLIAAATRMDLPLTSKRVRKFITPTHHRADKILNLGFVPRFNTEEGLRKMVSWYVSEHSNRMKVV